MYIRAEQKTELKPEPEETGKNRFEKNRTETETEKFKTDPI